MGNQADIREKSKKLKHLIDDASTIAVFGHVHPDGDCIGSTLAVYNYIQDNFQGKTVDVYAENFASSFRFLNGAKKIRHDVTDQRYDLGISIDVSSVDRLGKFQGLYNSCISTVCIDHHVSNPGFGDLCYIDGDASSASEVFTDLIDMEKVSKAAAECLYLGIVHDTGVFKYSCTHRKTMEVAGALLEKGVDSAYIIDETFYKKTYRQNMLMSRVVLESNLYDKGKIISGFIPKSLFREFKCTSLDTDGIVEQLRLTEGVEVAIFVYQITRKNFKFSLRSKNYVDVSAIAKTFGGGGHVRAAGFSAASYEKTMDVLLDLIRQQLKK